MMKHTKIGHSARPRLLTVILCVIFASGCVTTNPSGGMSNPIKETFASDDPCSNNARNIGITVGVLAGAFLGNQMKHSNTSRILGAAAGAALGGYIGADMDHRRCELTKIARKNNLDMQFEEIKSPPTQTPDAAATPVSTVTPTAQRQAQASAAQEENQPVGMKVVLKDNGRQFQIGSDELSPEAQAYFRQIADQYAYDVQKNRLTPASSKEAVAAVEGLNRKRILLVGHTDDTGSSTLNADLSERRAKAVAKVFKDRAILEEHIFYQGAGETLPIADNRTEDGRARNRRVEIIDLSDDATLRTYLASRRPVMGYYRSVQDKVAASIPSAVPEQEKAKPKNEGGAKHKDSAKANTSTLGAGIVGMTPASVLPKSSGIDFGGVPVGDKIAQIDIGKIPAASGGFSLISSAQADEPMAGSCLRDRPRISHGVKSLKGDQEYGTDDYMPGLYGTSWADMVNGNLVALTRVTVLRDGGLPATRPTLLVYRDYDSNAKMKPSITETPEVNVYRGDKAILYRVFASMPMRCMDIVILNELRTEARGSSLYYDRAQTLYVASFNPKLAK